MGADGAKIDRVLGIYTRLMNGALINKAAEAARYSTSESSIQRDIDDIRNYLEVTDDNGGVINSVVYDRIRKGYRLERIYDVKLTNPEILAMLCLTGLYASFSSQKDRSLPEIRVMW